MDFRLILLLALTALPACSGLYRRPAPEASETEILDERTGNTLSVVSEPIVFARERNDVAAHARDYATLVAVQIDHSGKYSVYLLLYRWSTVDRRMSAPPEADQGELKILAEGRVIDLMPLDKMPLSESRSRELHVPSHGDVVPHAYPVDDATLGFIAKSTELSVRMPQEALDTPFTLWQDGRASLLQFLQRTGSP